MDHKDHPWPEPGYHSHRHKGREDYYRDQNYPLPDPRERDRYWAHPDSRYRAHYTSPPARVEPYPYSSYQYYGYGQPEHQRPPSRHGYDYPPHSHWDYRDNYGYYDHEHHRGQQEQQDAGHWGPKDSWRTDYFHERKHKQEQSGTSYSEENRYEQGRDNSQHYLSDYDENRSRENEELSSYYLGTLESSKTSGLSSSSYELSQYNIGGDHSDPVHHTSDAECGPVRQVSAPLKYSIPHAVVSFGPAGQLVRVMSGFSTQENVSQLEIHSLEVILSETQEQEEMRNFPGPLAREDLHKVDAIEFAHQKASACMRDNTILDKSSAALLWKLLILLCRQNGQIVGSDIAELLVQGSRSEGNGESDALTLIDFSESSNAEAPPQKGDDLLTGNWSSFSSETSEKALKSYTQLLLAGRKKEALESAMSSGLWGHALFLASKMDNRSYTTVLNRFTGQLKATDPLQTLFQLLCGRIPVAATCSGNEKLGDWRPHLAVMLSNETGDAAVHQRAIVTMGDTLASRGFIHAAHVCYLTASVPFGVFTQKADRLVLLGSSHRRSFESFAKNSAIQCTELYEYCLTLGGRGFSVPSFQVYKFLYASRLLDCGLASQAFHYCEVVGQAIIRQAQPFFVLTGEVIKLADRLRHSEGQFSEAGVGGAAQEPDWLQQLRTRHHSLQEGNYDCATHQSAPERCTLAHEDNKTHSESGLGDLRCDIQSPMPELLYYRGSEEQESLIHQTEGNMEEVTALSWDVRGAQDRPHTSPPGPVTVIYAPPVTSATTSQDFSYHNTDSAEVITASPHCPQSNVSSDGAWSCPGTGMMVGQMLELDISHQGQNQQSIPTGSESSEPPKHSNKTGWFSGWFKSKHKEVEKDSSEQGQPTQTDPPPTRACPPPPATMSNDMFSQPTSAGINPFSRKAGQQLG